MRRISVALGLMVAALHAHSLLAATGLAYTVKTIHSNRIDAAQTFTVVRSGERAHASLIDGPPGEGVLYDGLLQTDRSHLIALNSRNRTWYPLESLRPFALDSRYLAPVLKPKIRNVQVHLDPPSQSPKDTHLSHQTGEISYDLHQSITGHGVRISCVARFQVTTSDAFDRNDWIGQLLPETGYPPVDAEMRSVEARIGGFPIRLSLDAERTFEGGATMHDRMRIDVIDIHEAVADDARFVRPADYLQQKPVILSPGVDH
jgi:hypothetical protein